jgi:hypothetical protein
MNLSIEGRTVRSAEKSYRRAARVAGHGKGKGSLVA